MTLLQSDFEVAPSGSAIPTTGGAAAFTAGSDGTGTTFVSDSSVPAAVASGTYSAKITIPSTAATAYRGWNWSGGVIHTRQYVYLTAYPNNNFTIWENRNGSTIVSRHRISTTGEVGIAVGGTSTNYSTGVLPLNTLCRIETSYNHAAGTMSVDAYLAHSTSPIAGTSLSFSSLSFPSSTITNVRAGVTGTVSSFTLRTDAWAASDTARVGPLVLGSTIIGATAIATATASGGTVSGTIGAPVAVAGVTASVVVVGGNRPIPPEPVNLGAAWPPDPYRAVIRSGGYALTYSVSASFGGVPVPGATDLRPTGGTIIDTTKPGVRRVLNLQLAPEPGLFARLAPIGTLLTVTARVTYPNRTVQDIPMGVFDVDSETLSEGGGGLSLTAPDKWVRIQRARFVTPASSSPGILVVDQIASLVRGALGSLEPVAVSATSVATVGALTWEKDRDKAIIDLAASIGAWVYFDRNGNATIADVPAVGATADWLVDSSATGVLTELDRERSRTDTCNVVVVESSAAGGEGAFPTQVVWDNDPTSPTYAGPDPIGRPELAGPFGVVVYYYDTPLPLGAYGARMAGLTILSRVSGLASQVSFGQAPNPAVDAFSVLDVLPPRERYDIPRVLERHVADTVTHPLTVGGGEGMHIEGRSTRTEALTGGL